MDQNDIANASKQIGLTASQAEDLWQTLQEIQKNKPASNFSSALLYFGSIIAFLSMTWFYIAHLKHSYCLLVSIVYSLTFFCTGSYLWHVKKLKTPGGLLSSLSVVMFPLMIYSLQNVMGLWPVQDANSYASFYYWIQGHWMPMEIGTLVAACIVLYFIRFPFITALIYFTLSFLSMDAVHLFVDPQKDSWLYYCLASIILGGLLNILAVILDRKGHKDFGFWSYLFGTFLCWSGLACWDIKTEGGYFIYFLINLAFILSSDFFHRKIFRFFGSLGIISYVGHLAYIFSDSMGFSYVLGITGFAMMMVAVFFLRPKKAPQSA